MFLSYMGKDGQIDWHAEASRRILAFSYEHILKLEESVCLYSPVGLTTLEFLRMYTFWVCATYTMIFPLLYKR
jgi:hypothetical protein